MYAGDCLCPDLTLLDVVYMYKWNQDAPLKFLYTVLSPPSVRARKRTKPKPIALDAPSKSPHLPTKNSPVKRKSPVSTSPPNSLPSLPTLEGKETALASGGVKRKTPPSTPTTTSPTSPGSEPNKKRSKLVPPEDAKCGAGKGTTPSTATNTEVTPLVTPISSSSPRLNGGISPLVKTEAGAKDSEGDEQGLPMETSANNQTMDSLDSSRDDGEGRMVIDESAQSPSDDEHTQDNENPLDAKALDCDKSPSISPEIPMTSSSPKMLLNSSANVSNGKSSPVAPVKTIKVEERDPSPMVSTSSAPLPPTSAPSMGTVSRAPVVAAPSVPMVRIPKPVPPLTPVTASRQSSSLARLMGPDSRKPSPSVSRSSPKLVPSVSRSSPNLLPSATSSSPKLVPSVSSSSPKVVPSATSSSPKLVPSATTSSPKLVPSSTSSSSSSSSNKFSSLKSPPDRLKVPPLRIMKSPQSGGRNSSPKMECKSVSTVPHTTAPSPSGLLVSRASGGLPIPTSPSSGVLSSLVESIKASVNGSPASSYSPLANTSALPGLMSFPVMSSSPSTSTQSPSVISAVGASSPVSPLAQLSANQNNAALAAVLRAQQQQLLKQMQQQKVLQQLKQQEEQQRQQQQQEQTLQQLYIAAAAQAKSQQPFSAELSSLSPQQALVSVAPRMSTTAAISPIGPPVTAAANSSQASVMTRSPYPGAVFPFGQRPPFINPTKPRLGRPPNPNKALTSSRGTRGGRGSRGGGRGRRGAIAAVGGRGGPLPPVLAPQAPQGTNSPSAAVAALQQQFNLRGPSPIMPLGTTIANYMAAEAAVRGMLNLGGLMQQQISQSGGGESPASKIMDLSPNSKSAGSSPLLGMRTGTVPPSPNPHASPSYVTMASPNPYATLLGGPSAPVASSPVRSSSSPAEAAGGVPSSGSAAPKTASTNNPQSTPPPQPPSPSAPNNICSPTPEVTITKLPPAPPPPTTSAKSSSSNTISITKRSTISITASDGSAAKPPKLSKHSKPGKNTITMSPKTTSIKTLNNNNNKLTNGHAKPSSVKLERKNSAEKSSNGGSPNSPLRDGGPGLGGSSILKIEHLTKSLPPTTVTASGSLNF